jgi:hypothetical protein
MPATEMIVSIAVLAALALIVIQLFRLLGTAIRHKTVRRVLDRDPAAAERAIAELSKPEETTGDDRLGLILFALGIATVAASFTAGDTGGWTDYGIGAAMFPLIVGAALMLRHFVIERARRRGEQQ